MIEGIADTDLTEFEGWTLISANAELTPDGLGNHLITGYRLTWGRPGMGVQLETVLKANREYGLEAKVLDVMRMKIL